MIQRMYTLKATGRGCALQKTLNAFFFYCQPVYTRFGGLELDEALANKTLKRMYFVGVVKTD